MCPKYLQTAFDWFQGPKAAARGEAAFQTWDAIWNLFRQRGVSQLYLKQLAPKQDNEKNQIYLGKGSFEKIQFIVPFTLQPRGKSKSTAKKGSKPSDAIQEGLVPWKWIARDGNANHAPGTRAILYLQYPELRLSGFLDKCRASPRSLRRRFLEEYGTRVLVFGTAPDGFVYGIVVTQAEDPGLFPLPAFPKHKANPLLCIIELEKGAVEKLLADLCRINSKGWIPAQRLKRVGDPPLAFKGTQGAGYTLEALLGIQSNASKEPDRDGVEIKSYLRGKISLMTPVPDGGVQGLQGLVPFLKRFGKQDKDDPDRWLFNGTHKFGVQNAGTGLVLTVTGYDRLKGFTGPEADVEVALIDPETGTEACAWSFAKLFEAWNKKHSKAAYVAAKKEAVTGADHDANYSFGEVIWICEGTSPKRLLDAILTGDVVYDPGDTSKSGKTGKPKPRPQWRLAGLKGIPALYDKVTRYEINAGRLQTAT